MEINLKEKVKKGATIAIVLVSVATIGILGGSTYSKYFQRIDGEGSATIARWSFKANEQTQKIANIKLTNTYNENKLLKNTIAPGTSGSFDIVLDATGADVAIDYAVTFDNLQNKPQNLKFTYNGTTANSLEGLENVLKGRIGLNDSRTKTLTINWDWQYETGNSADAIALNDERDTQDAGKTFTFDVKITGTQVNPKENA